jgi:hypothetical protein
MEVVAFHPAHLAEITPPAATPEQLDWLCRYYHPLGPAWSGVDAGRIVGCGGIAIDGDTGRAWAILSHPVRAICVHRLAARVLDPVCEELGLRRLEASALVNWPSACHWLERLGFRFEHQNGEYGVYVR